MRFEIKTGGIAAILVGVAALSFAVFLLGLLAGYDVGRESQTSAAQVATAYPVGAPPDSATNSVPAPAAVPSPARQVASAAVAPAPMPVKTAVPVKATAPIKPAAAVAPDAPIAPLASADTLTPKRPKAAARATPSDDDDDYPEPIPNASEVPPPSGRVTAPTRHAAAEDDTNDTADNDAEVDAPAPARTPRAAPTVVASARPAQPSESPLQARHKPFNIQIEAAMDSNSANQMSQRLRALGYQSHLVPAHLNGQTWYKIVIGPYPTQEAASAAQTEMRAKYNNVYGSRTANASGTGN